MGSVAAIYLRLMPSGWWRLLAMLLVSFSLCALAVEPAGAETRVGRGLQVLAGGEEREAPGDGRVVVDARGDAVAFWTVDGVVAAAVRRAGRNAWRVAALAGGQPPLPRTGMPPLFDSEPVGAIQAAMSATGEAVVAWERSGGGEGSTVEAATFDVATGRWGRPAKLFSQREPLLAPIAVAIDARGDAIVTWEGDAPGRFPDVVQAATKPAVGGWQPGDVLSSTSGEGEDPRVAIDERGDGLVVWEEHEAIEGRSSRRERSEVVQASSMPVGGHWTAVVDLSPLGEQDEHPTLAVDGRGDAVVAWENVDVEETPSSVARVAGEENTRVYAVTRKGHEGAWTQAEQLSADTGQFASEPTAATTAHGAAMVVWQDDKLDKNTLDVAARSGLAWRPPIAVAHWTHLSAPIQPGCSAGACLLVYIRPLPGAEPKLALSGRGAVVAWRRADSYEGIAESAVVGASGHRARQRLSGGSVTEVQLALVCKDEPLVAWTRVLETKIHYVSAIEVARGPSLNQSAQPSTHRCAAASR